MKRAWSASESWTKNAVDASLKATMAASTATAAAFTSLGDERSALRQSLSGVPAALFDFKDDDDDGVATSREQEENAATRLQAAHRAREARKLRESLAALSAKPIGGGFLNAILCGFCIPVGNETNARLSPT